MFLKAFAMHTDWSDLKVFIWISVLKGTSVLPLVQTCAQKPLHTDPLGQGTVQLFVALPWGQSAVLGFLVRDRCAWREKLMGSEDFLYW